VAVGVLVTVHEFGHFWVARRLGFKVLRFSVGFGRPLLKRIAGADRIEYVVAAVPLGGYVKLLDEREGPVAPHELSRSFTRRPPWQRIVVLLAGPAFNILFAVLVLGGMLWANGVTEIRPLVGEVVPGSVAAGAGLRPGDGVRGGHRRAVAGRRAGAVIQAIDGTSVHDSREIVALISAHPGERVTIDYARGGVAHRVQLEVQSEPVGGKRLGRIHVMQPKGSGYPESMLRHTDLG